jgi:hypothetical protein
MRSQESRSAEIYRGRDAQHKENRVLASTGVQLPSELPQKKMKGSAGLPLVPKWLSF